MVASFATDGRGMTGHPQGGRPTPRTTTHHPCRGATHRKLRGAQDVNTSVRNGLRVSIGRAHAVAGAEDSTWRSIVEAVAVRGMRRVRVTNRGAGLPGDQRTSPTRAGRSSWGARVCRTTTSPGGPRACPMRAPRWLKRRTETRQSGAAVVKMAGTLQSGGVVAFNSACRWWHGTRRERRARPARATPHGGP